MMKLLINDIVSCVLLNLKICQYSERLQNGDDSGTVSAKNGGCILEVSPLGVYILDFGIWVRNRFLMINNRNMVPVRMAYENNRSPFVEANLVSIVA